MAAPLRCAPCRTGGHACSGPWCSCVRCSMPAQVQARALAQAGWKRVRRRERNLRLAVGSIAAVRSEGGEAS